MCRLHRVLVWFRVLVALKLIPCCRVALKHGKAPQADSNDDSRYVLAMSGFADMTRASCEGRSEKDTSRYVLYTLVNCQIRSSNIPKHVNNGVLPKLYKSNYDTGALNDNSVHD